MLRILAVACLMIAPSWVLSASAQSKPVPPEVEQYIRANNFVAAFSTPEELHALSRYDDPEDVKQETGSERLGEVFARVRQVEALEIEVDPKMLMPKRPEREKSIPGRILQVKKVHALGSDRMFVEVLAHRLEREAVTQLIAAYEESDTPPEIEEALSRVATEREVQEWVRVDGSWRKKEASLLYLDP